ncbi:MAG: multidrug efflux pump subunit AcrB [Candidatus Azotimanducaceae bacterium]
MSFEDHDPAQIKSKMGWLLVNITTLSLRYKAAIAVIVGLLCLFGYNSIQKLPVQLLPDTSSPQITIFNNWRAAAPQELEEAIIQPQEEQLQFNSGLESMVSSTSRGQGRLTLNYSLGYDMKQALLDVINRLNQTRALPIDAGEPFVASGGDGGLPNAASILVYTAEGNSETDMVVYQDLIEEVVEPRLARIPGVARVNLNGRRPKEISIVVNPLKIAVLGLQVTDITNALNRARDISGGFADVGRRRYTVRFLGEQEVSQLGELVVGWNNQQPIYLNDVAEVEVNYAENSGVSLRNGFPSYYITISRQNDSNTVELLDELNIALAELNEGRLKDENLRIQLSFDASLHIRRAISMVQGNIILGVFLASLVLFYFLNNARATLVITLTVPICLLVAFIVLDLVGLTLNVISLAGLAFAVGLVMDAAIVVQENIFRLRQSGMQMTEAVVEGCRQVSGALFSSTLTTVAIFLPVLYMVGIEGQLFKDLAITISVAVMASLITALTILPVLTEKWLVKAITEDRFSQAWSKLADFVVLLTDSISRRFLWIGGLLSISIFLVWILIPKIDFLPNANIDAIQVFFNVPAGMSTDTIQNELAPEVVRRLEPYFTGEKTPKIRAYNFASFGGLFTQVFIYPEKPDEVEALVQLLRDEILIGLPDVRSFVSQASMLQVGNGGGRSINVDIQGNDIAKLFVAAREGQRVIEGLWEGGNVFAQGGLSLDEPELQILPIDRKINSVGLDRSSVGGTIRAYTDGLYSGEYFDGNERMDMFVRTNKWNTPEDLLKLPIATPSGGVQQIGNLVKIDRAVGPTNLTRVDGRRTVTLNVIPPPGITLEEALEDLHKIATPAMKKFLGSGESIKYRGNADRLKQALEEIRKNFLFALVILFMIMAALFKSVKDSAIVLIVMPLALAGGFAGLKILNIFTYQSLDMLTMIGFIILLGLVVNNAILLVDQTRGAERDGLSKKDAVRQALTYRARPIFMSTLTSIFGMLPLMLIPGVGSEIYRGLATVIVGGMVFSSVFTLVLLPSLLRVEFQSGQLFQKSPPLKAREAI